MSRLQVLPLPTATVGEYQHTPFVLVIDQVTDDKEWSMAAVHHLKEHTRAEVVIVHEGTLDVSEPLELTPEQADNLRRYLTEPVRFETDSTEPEGTHADPGHPTPHPAP